jgi:hypothetical protein
MAARDAARNHDLDMGLGGELVHGVGHRLGRHMHGERLRQRAGNETRPAAARATETERNGANIERPPYARKGGNRGDEGQAAFLIRRNAGYPIVSASDRSALNPAGVLRR